MTILNIILIAVTILIVLLLIKHTKVNKQKEDKYIEPLTFQPLTIDKIKDFYNGEDLICKVGFLYYQLTKINTIEKEDEGLFIGYAKADANHKGRILIYDETCQQRGWIDNQEDLHKKLVLWKKSAAYGFSRKQGDNHFIGKVCIRIR